MIEPKPRRGRPKLALEDNETYERILNVAQQLFAEKGFSKVTLRELTSAAETNLAAVNYYFGSKEKLLSALIGRSAKAVQKQRMDLLREVRERGGDRVVQVTGILRALLLPAIVPVKGQDTGYLYSALIASSTLEDSVELTDILQRETSHLDPFIEALHEVLPEVSMADLYWRMHFVLNVEHAVHTETTRLAHLSKGLCDASDRELMLDKILAFAVPGVLAGL